MKVKSWIKTMVGFGLAASLSVSCAVKPVGSPEPNPPVPADTFGGAQPPFMEPEPVDMVQPPDVPPPPPIPVPVPIIRNPFVVAFTATSCFQGNLFLYDDRIKDVYILNGAVAGLFPPGWAGNVFLTELNPQLFNETKILFEFLGHIYYYDMLTEERVEVAFDGWCGPGGARPSVSETGLLLYKDKFGNLVLKPIIGPFLTQSRVITKVAAEIEFNNFTPFAPYLGIYNFSHFHVCSSLLDAQISADGLWVVVNIKGKLYLYDVLNPQLFQILPLDGISLAGGPGNIGHVAISEDGRLIAFTAISGFTERLLILDRVTGLIDTAPYANLGNIGTIVDPISDPYFAGGFLFFNILTPGGYRVWRYDLATGLLNGMVILNNALGELGTNVTISDPFL
ncbi:hypothetical protein D3C86_456160 [compost metagenome]